MRYLSFSIDNRALLEGEGHSKLWHRRMGLEMERMDVLVESRPGDGLRDTALTDNVRILPVAVPHPLLYPLLALRRGLAEHRIHHYQVVSCEDPFRPGLAALLFHHLTGVPLCPEYHTDCFFNPAWRAERPLIHRVYEWIGRRVVRSASAVRVVNQKNRKELLRLCSDQPGKLISVVPVPTRFYEPPLNDEPARLLRRELLAGDESGVIILFVGRMAPVKRVDELLRLFARLRPRYPQARLVLLGGGSELENLKRLAGELGEERIIFTDYVSEAEVFNYYGAADLFVNSADWEPYGRVYLEAMSAGLPVVTTAQSGAVEDGTIVHERTGLVFTPEQPGALEAAVERLLADPSLARRLGQAGRELVLSQHDYSVRVRQMKELWEATIARKNAKNGTRN